MQTISITLESEVGRFDGQSVCSSNNKTTMNTPMSVLSEWHWHTSLVDTCDETHEHVCAPHPARKRNRAKRPNTMPTAWKQPAILSHAPEEERCD
eukprot:3373444-Amphidinium_carterae.1